jgi:exodeoxyribonuclease VII small subunit
MPKKKTTTDASADEARPKAARKRSAKRPTKIAKKKKTKRPDSGATAVEEQTDENPVTDETHEELLEETVVDEVAATGVSFEDALYRLGDAVRELEQGSLSLDESLARYEQGIHYLAQCQRILESAERKIELLSGFDADGNPITEDFADQTMTLEEKADRRSHRRTASTSLRIDENHSADGSKATSFGGKRTSTSGNRQRQGGPETRLSKGTTEGAPDGGSDSEENLDVDGNGTLF